MQRTMRCYTTRVPLNDLMPIRMDNCYTHQLAFSLGGAEFFGHMTSDNLHGFLTAASTRSRVSYNIWQWP